VGESDRYEAVNMSDMIIVLDTALDEQQEFEGIAREITNRVQKLRKSAGLLATDAGVKVYYSLSGKQKTDLEKLNKTLTHFLGFIQENTKTELLPMSEFKGEALGSSKTKINTVDLELKLIK